MVLLVSLNGDSSVLLLFGYIGVIILIHQTILARFKWLLNVNFFK